MFNIQKEDEFFPFKPFSDLAKFKEQTEVVVAHHIADDIRDAAGKKFSRDLFAIDNPA
jgi:hypothetical protein